MSDQENVTAPTDTIADPHLDTAPTTFPVVGIGASAGGLVAFREFLSRLSNDSGMAFVLVQHLAPQHESQLVPLLAKNCTLPIVEANDGMVIQPNHVYIIPPNADLALTNGTLRLTPRGETHGLHLTIDFFLRSLARDCANRAIGVVLSGTGSDGTLGLAEIKSVGGITFAQDPASAEHAGMPASAIAYGCADFVRTPEEIAAELIAISRHVYLRSDQTKPDTDPFPQDQASYAAVLSALKEESHIDFTLYRDTTIKRRILRRMALRSVTTLPDYLRTLTEDENEITILLKDVLINVTSFFRDAAVFEAVRTLVFPRLTHPKGNDNLIRLWVVACSTGQEAYSLAIELIEHFDHESNRRPIQIFATDISESSLVTARAGIYPATIENEVSPERLRRHFTRVPEGYRVNKSVRDMCVFARHDVTTDIPFSKIDLISCRNVLIYLTPALQARVIPTLFYTLNPGGFLVLGSSETVGRAADLFDTIDAKHRVYVKRAGVTRVNPPPIPNGRRVAEDTPVAAARPPSVADLQRAADRIIMNRYAPAGVLVDSDLNIIQFRGKTAPFLEPTQGQASLNLLKMVPHGLAQELTKAIAEAKAQNTTLRRRGVRVRDGQRLRDIDVEVSLVRLPGLTEPAILILFEESTAPVVQVDAPATASGTPSAGDYAQLRQELAAANDYQQSLSDENNAINDELRFAHDEAVSSNEELRCTNEELQTAKEEIESANEELGTLNEELRNRNLELTHLSNDLSNLLDGMALPVLMLDADLRIRRISGPTPDILHLSTTDLGRQVRGLDLGFTGPALDETVDEVIASRTSKAVETRDRSGRWYSLRVTPYRTEGDLITGAVATYIDIDVVKRIQESLRKSGDAAIAIVETVRDPLLVVDAELRIHTANRAFTRVFSIPREKCLGQLLPHLGDGLWDIPELKRLFDGILNGGDALDDFAITHTFPGMGRRTMLLNARLLEGTEDNAPMIVLVIADVTERVRMTEELKSIALDLKRSNAELEQFASIASHDLQEPLRTIRSFATLLQERLGDKLVGRDREFMEHVVSGVKRMQELVKAILYYSEVGHQGITAELIDAGEIARLVVANLEDKITKVGATVTIHHLPMVLADATLLTQLLQNLVSNGIKFRARDRVPTIAIGSIEQADEWVLSVSDNGIGIRPQDQGRIFNLFQRAHSGTDYPGTGIGLATCKKIIERHGGRLWLESTPDIGTTFFLSLPKVANVSPSA